MYYHYKSNFYDPEDPTCLEELDKDLNRLNQFDKRLQNNKDSLYAKLLGYDLNYYKLLKSNCSLEEIVITRLGELIDEVKELKSHLNNESIDKNNN